MKKGIYLLVLQLTALFVLNSCIKKDELVLPANPQPIVQNLANTNSYFSASLQGFGVSDTKISVSNPVYVFNSADSTGTLAVTDGSNNSYTFTFDLKEGNKTLTNATANYSGINYSYHSGSFNITTPTNQVSSVLTGTFNVFLSWIDGSDVKLIYLNSGSFLAKNQ